jgi:hypothetical protein
MNGVADASQALHFRHPSNDGWVRIDPWPLCTASWRRDESWQWQPYPAVKFNLRRLVRSVEARRTAVVQRPLFDDPAHDADYKTWEAQRAFLENIPHSVRHAVMAFRDQHLSLLRIAATGPYAEQLLSHEACGHPALVYAVARFLSTSATTTPCDEIADFITQPRRVIAERLGWSLAPSGVRFLTRIAPRHLSPSVLRAALSLVNERKRPPHIGATTPVTPILLSILVHPVLGPKVTPCFAHEVSGEAMRHRTQLRRMLLQLVDREAGGDRQRYAQVWPFESFQQLAARARVLREGGAIDDAPVTSFPRPPLRLESGRVQLWPITTPRALTQEGELMNHCVANYMREIGVLKTHFAYRLIVPERATVLIAWRGKRWVLVDARKADNVGVSLQTRTIIRSLITRAQEAPLLG